MKCLTKWCRRQVRQKGGKSRGHCSKCSMRQWRAANPLKDRLAHLKDRAARKRVPFDLDLEWLTAFLTDNHYNPTLHHIDRIRTWEGYTKANLQVLLMSENIAKGNRERWVAYFQHDPF